MRYLLALLFTFTICQAQIIPTEGVVMGDRFGISPTISDNSIKWFTDQSILTAVTLNRIDVSGTDTVRVDWGDGTDTLLYGTNNTPVKSYTSTGTYTITFSRDVESMTMLHHAGQVKSFGDIGSWKIPNQMLFYRIFNNNFSGNLSSQILPSGIQWYQIFLNSFTGNLTNQIIPSSLTLYRVYDNNFTGLATGTTTLTDYQAQGNSVLTPGIDDFMSRLNTLYTGTSPIQNQSYDISGTGMGYLTGSENNTDLIAVRDAFTSSGNVLTLTYNLQPFSQVFEWKPNIIFPDTIFISSADLDTIYHDDIGMEQDDEKNLTYTYTSSIGSITPNQDYEFNTETPGNYQLIANTSYNDTIRDADTTIINIFNDTYSAIDSTSILVIGNSLVVMGEDTMIDTIRNKIDQAKMVGSKGTNPTKHEGNGGKDYNWFVGTESPFYIGGQLDFFAYRWDTLQLTDTIDYVVIQLGVNDVFGEARDTNWVDNQTIPSIKTLIDAINQDTVTHIIIGITPHSTNNGQVWFNDYGSKDQEKYIYEMRYLWRKIYEEIDGYAANVSISNQGLFINRSLGYPNDDALHPNDFGFYQIGNQIANRILKLLN